MTDKILIIIPCYNEAGSLINLLNALKNLPYDTLVIDDGSTDNTYAIASEHVACIRHEQNRGVGHAILTGICYARDNGYTLCLRMDGDGQHRPAELTALLDAYRAQAANIIIGSRYAPGGHYRTTALRRAAAWSLAWWLAILYAKPRLHDPISGMRLMDTAAIDYFSTHYSATFPEAVEIARGYRQGFSIREVPIHVETRSSGKSSLKGVYAVWIYMQMVGVIVRVRFGGKS